jgi:hypothetical protein
MLDSSFHHLAEKGRPVAEPPYTFVIPAKAGIHLLRPKKQVDPGSSPG